MNSDLEKLIELEKTDREITRLSEEVSALPKRVASIEEKLVERVVQVEEEDRIVRRVLGRRRARDRWIARGPRRRG